MLWLGDLASQLARECQCPSGDPARAVELRRKISVAACQVERVLPHATLPIQLATDAFDPTRRTRPNRMAVRLLSHLLFQHVHGERGEATVRNLCLAACNATPVDYEGYLKATELLYTLHFCGFVRFRGPYLSGSALVLPTPLLLHSMLQGYGLPTGLARTRKKTPKAEMQEPSAGEEAESP